MPGTLARLSHDRRPRVFSRIAGNIWFLAALSFLMSSGLTMVAYFAAMRKLGIDDAYIYFTYAQNVAEGRGIIFSEGVTPVEGYTSTLWMLLVSAAFGLGLGKIGVLALNLIALAISQLFLMRILQVLVPGHLYPLSLLVYVSLVSSSGGYAAWMTITLMDLSTWGLLIATLTYFLVLPPRSRSRWRALLLVAIAAPLVRPEAIVVVPVFLLILALRRFMNSQRLLPLVVLGVAFGISLSSLTLFRLIYFGHPLPNTYYAKVSPSLSYNLREGSDYLLSFLSSSPISSVSIFLIVLTILAPIFRFNPFSSNFIDLNIFVAVLALLPVLTGGDHFGMHRFYQPIFPMLVVVLVMWATALLQKGVPQRLSRGWLRPFLFRGLSLLFVVVWAFLFSSDYSWWKIRQDTLPILSEFTGAEVGLSYAYMANKVFDSTSTNMPAIGVIVVGGFSSAYVGPTVDLMGLNNQVIAHYPGSREGVKNHAAFEKDVFFRLEVDILLMAPAETRRTDEIMKDLFYDSRFVAAWRYGRVEKIGEPNTMVSGLVNVSYLYLIENSDELQFVETLRYSPSSGLWEPPI